jgi:hypothetical protein
MGLCVCKTHNVNEMFYNFQCTLLRFSETSFPISYEELWSNSNNCLTKGIKKTEHYLTYRKNKDHIQTREFYIKYYITIKSYNRA